MAFYECKKAITDQLGECLNLITIKKGLDVQRWVNEHKQLTSSVNDPYSAALLKKNAGNDFPPLFANIPSRNFSWLLRDHFEEVFEALGFPTTQQQADRFWKSIRNRSLRETLNNHQEEALLKTEFVSKEIAKISDWCTKARAMLVSMNANVELLSSVTEEEREFARSLRFDWYYGYSDDHSVWRAGQETRRVVARRVHETLSTKPHLAKVVKEVTQANNLSHDFFTRFDN